MRLGGRKFYAVVKADAYGHGAAEVALALQEIADGFCVAICREGAELRLAGITKPILVFAPVLDAYDRELCAFYNLTVTVNSLNSAKLCCGLDCHIKVNTGMNRYGCHAEELEEILAHTDKERVKGVYSHLYKAEDEKVCAEQKEVFSYAAEKVKAYSPEAVAHLSASGGILRGKDYLFDGARCGIMLYGYCPSGFKAEGLTPALKVYARLAQETKPVGGGVGYNTADKKYETLYTYRLGYADGFFRGVPLGEKTLCMDAFVSEKKEELLCVFGDAELYADCAGTISYEALCSVTRRSVRIYEGRAEI